MRYFINENNITVHDIFMIHDIVIMVIQTEDDFEYYVRDCDNNFGFKFVFGVVEEFSKDHLDNLYCTGYFDSILEVTE